MIRYRSCRPPDTDLREHLRELANERKRFGYRRLFVLLRQEAASIGSTGRKVSPCASGGHDVASWVPGADLVETIPNARWSIDFVHDQFACGRRFRILNIVDDVTRECLVESPTPRSRDGG